MIVPPENQGQAVEVAYTNVGEGYVLRRRIDRSDLSVAYAIARCLRSDEGDYWNGAPKNKRWRPITAAAAERWLRED